MTNERAVEILNLVLDILGQYGGETAEAYKMAIKALEAQPQPIVMTKEEFERYLANEDLVVVKRKLLNEALESQLMRDATEEERKSVKDYIESISKPTGLQFEAQPCEDCISRQAVIILIDEASEMHPYKVVGDSDTYSNYNQGWSDACDWLYANIEGVPSVTPKYTDEEIDKAQAVEQAYVDKMVELAVEEAKRPKGKWIEVEVRNVYATLKCSVCGRVIEPIFDFCKYSYEDIKRSYPYCHCGAYMGGGEDEVNN